MGYSGPKFNIHDSRFTSRDNLGINGVLTTMQAQLCPVVNQVTPRVFYWIFLNWNYYDYIKNSGISSNKWNRMSFNHDFVKKNDYYFILGNLICGNDNTNMIVGHDNVGRDLNKNPRGPYKYNDKYYSSIFGGMQYYNAGLYSMRFILDNDETPNFPGINKKTGVELAKEFEKVISKTTYYKKYRFSNKPVPKTVLKELGEMIRIDLYNLNICKKYIRNALFEEKPTIDFDNRNLILSRDYVNLIYKTYGEDALTINSIREILYEKMQDITDVSNEMTNMIINWEVIIGRQLFTIAIELIWKSMIYNLVGAMTESDWIDNTIHNSTWKEIKLNVKINKYIDKEYKYDKLQKLIESGYRNIQDVDLNLNNAIIVLFSVYKKFKSNRYYDIEFIKYGDDISIANLIDYIDEHNKSSIKEFIVMIMKKWIIESHKITALNKMVEGRDGYYFIYDDGYYHSIDDRLPSPDFQGIRLVQLKQVMKDLGILNGK